ncbi:MAG: hypothetical protein ACRDR6_10650 [Pseudonocardiaceae bacterium]
MSGDGTLDGTTSDTHRNTPSQPPTLVAAASVMSFINSALVGLYGVIVYVRALTTYRIDGAPPDWPALPLASRISAGIGASLIFFLVAVFTVIIAARMSRGNRSTRWWAMVIASLSFLLSLAFLGEGDVPFGLPVMLLSIAVLVAVNLPESQRFFQHRSGQ